MHTLMFEPNLCDARMAREIDCPGPIIPLPKPTLAMGINADVMLIGR